MRTTERAPVRTTTPFGGPPVCLLLGTPFMDRVLPPECGPRGEVAPLLLGASRRPGCVRFESRMRFRSQKVGFLVPWLKLRRVPRRPFASSSLRWWCLGENSLRASARRYESQNTKSSERNVSVKAPPQRRCQGQSSNTFEDSPPGCPYNGSPRRLRLAHG